MSRWPLLGEGDRGGGGGLLLETKLRGFSPSSEMIVRPRLSARLIGSDASLVLFAAPPGFGKTTLLAQWRELRPVPEQQLQVGDVVVLGSKKSGLTGSGVYLGEDLVIASEAEAGHVAVRRMKQGELYGARRATLLPPATQRPVPAAANCGLVEEVVDPDRKAAVHPDNTERYHLFRADLAELSVVRLNDARDRLVIESWHPGRGVTRRERR